MKNLATEDTEKKNEQRPKELLATDYTDLVKRRCSQIKEQKVLELNRVAAEDTEKRSVTVRVTIGVIGHIRQTRRK